MLGYVRAGVRAGRARDDQEARSDDVEAIAQQQANSGHGSPGKCSHRRCQ